MSVRLQTIISELSVPIKGTLLSTVRRYFAICFPINNAELGKSQPA